MRLLAFALLVGVACASGVHVGSGGYFAWKSKCLGFEFVKGTDGACVRVSDGGGSSFGLLSRALRAVPYRDIVCA